jgi:hypothetical protein
MLLTQKEQHKDSNITEKKGISMASATTKLTAGWGFRARGGVQDVDTFRVAQGRTMPFFGEDIGTKLKIT